MIVFATVRSTFIAVEIYAMKFAVMVFCLICHAMMEIWSMAMDALRNVKLKEDTDALEVDKTIQKANVFTKER